MRTTGARTANTIGLLPRKGPYLRNIGGHEILP